MRAGVLLIIIITLAAFLRFWQLNEVPPALSWDEVAIGYNAWSVLKTGRDEYGQSLPLLFRSFDDYKLPGMVYSVAISEWLLGINEWGVRLSSALFGIGTVIVIYFLTREFFLGVTPKSKVQSPKLNSKFKMPSLNSLDIGNWSLVVALLAGMLAAINPWLINFSRQAFESNGATFWFALGIYFLLKSVRNIEWLSFSAVIFAISIYFYYSVRVVLPAILLIFTVVYFQYLRRNRGVVLVSFFVGLVILLPLLPAMFSARGFERIGIVAVSNDPAFIEKQAVSAEKILASGNALWARIVYNRRLALFQTVTENYLKNISPSHLFSSGTGNFGLFYFWEGPFLLSGLYFLLKSEFKFKWVILVWALVSPLAGALTKDQPNALRVLIGAPAFVILGALGLWQGWLWARGRLRGLASLGYLGAMAILVIWGFFSFFQAYFYDLPRTRALHFGDGYKQLAEYLKPEVEEYDTIWVSGDYWRPYIHLLFHLKYPPAAYQNGGSKNSFANFKFGAARWDKEGVLLQEANLDELIEGDTLFILSKREYESLLGRFIFKKKETIDGMYTKGVFYAVEM